MPFLRTTSCALVSIRNNTEVCLQCSSRLQFNSRLVAVTSSESLVLRHRSNPFSLVTYEKSDYILHVTWTRCVQNAYFYFFRYLSVDTEPPRVSSEARTPTYLSQQVSVIYIDHGIDLYLTFSKSVLSTQIMA